MLFEGMECAVVRWGWDCGRAGSLEALFVVNEKGMALVRKLVETKHQINFGEVLGKHSEVYGQLEEDEFTVVAQGDDAKTVARVLCRAAHFDDDQPGYATISGNCPMDVLDAYELWEDYHVDDDDDEEEELEEPQLAPWFPNPYEKGEA